MSEMKGQKDYSRYDSMSTEQLREILRKHAHCELETMPDTEALFVIMEVLESREKEKPKSTEEAYDTFVKHYAPQMGEKKSIPFTKSSVAAPWMKRVAVIALIFVTLTVGAVTAEAFSPNFWGRVAVWTKDFFRFEDITDATEGKLPEKENNVEMDSLRAAMEQHKVAEKLAPNWIPEGYVCLNVSASKTPKELSISAMYERDKEYLIIKIRQVFGTTPQQIEKSEDLIETYSANGVEYYIFSNNESLQTAWVVGEFECMIAGKITLEEMKRVIDSI